METTTLVMDHHPPAYSRPASHRFDPHTGPPGRTHPGSGLIPAPRRPGDEAAGPERRFEIGDGMRNHIATRVVAANFEHARAAWARRRSDPIGPHVTIYLYSHGGSDPRLAYRVFLAADEPRLAHLLHQLVAHVRGQLAAGLDVRDVQCTTVEDGMPPDAVYLGLAVSSLDTPAGAWAEVSGLDTVFSEQHIPGRCYVWLVDDTVMVIDRGARDQFGRVQVYANEPVRAHGTMIGYPVTAVPELAIPQRQHIADPDVLTYLHELHHTVLAGGHPAGGRHVG